jgi:type IV pilus assembly protein PilB
MSDTKNPRLRAVSPDDGAATARKPEDEAWNGVLQPSRRGGAPRFLTDVIVELGLVNRERVEEAIATARASDTTPEQVLLSMGLLDQEGHARALAERYGLDFLDLTVFNVDMAAANLISIATAKRYDAAPVSFVNERTLLVAMVDPSNVLAVDDIAIMTGYEVRAAVATRDDITDLLTRLSRFGDVVQEAEEEEQPEIVELHESAEDAPIIKLVNQLIGQAVDQGASDLHLAPDGRDLRVRFRIDGVLHDINTVPRRMAAGVVSRIKIMSELDISERRLPQDGRVSMSVDRHKVDLRVVTLPSVHGEAVVIRILDKNSVVMELDKLGMSGDEYKRFSRSFAQAHGAILVTGPTGSGKSTTLYAALGVINTPDKNIITIEDPVEYDLEGITQIQINPRAGLTFATGLRSMMRADPDIIMVGEIRDRETAQIAVESSLTGHLVLSTLHTNDAPTAITRLIEMGIEPFLVGSAIECVVAQRLARTLCSHCKRRAIVSAEVLRDNGFNVHLDIEVYEPVGCRRCNGTGYRGRIGLYEVMMMSPDIRALTLERRSADEVAEVAVREGMRRLMDDGLQKVKAGRTSVAEVARVTGTNGHVDPGRTGPDAGARPGGGDGPERESAEDTETGPRLSAITGGAPPKLSKDGADDPDESPDPTGDE